MSGFARCSRLRSWAAAVLVHAVRGKAATSSGIWCCLVGFGKLKVRWVSDRRCMLVLGRESDGRLEVGSSNLHSAMRRWEPGVLAGCRVNYGVPYVYFQTHCELSFCFARNLADLVRRVMVSPRWILVEEISTG